MNLGILSEELGEFTIARAYYDESLQGAYTINNRQFIALGKYNLGCLHSNEGDDMTALPILRRVYSSLSNIITGALHSAMPIWD